ncbi:hypothetical protein PoB_006064800 [Plakobranchus ocellatus]|uniref:Uncharacterized protein n=1 Tax=Plakobranchus ocellatus TaxID=259542 RepID=A0AAV4CQI4_9GAST|nr:hypothetical protein PoB_006064800 [Plakobranchus ocellatus]
MKKTFTHLDLATDKTRQETRQDLSQMLLFLWKRMAQCLFAWFLCLARRLPTETPRLHSEFLLTSCSAGVSDVQKGEFLRPCWLMRVIVRSKVLNVLPLTAFSPNAKKLYIFLASVHTRLQMMAIRFLGFSGAHQTGVSTLILGHEELHS